MGKVIASYLVRVTLRERDVTADEAASDPITSHAPTIAEVEEAITDELESWDGNVTVNVTAERTDK